MREAPNIPPRNTPAPDNAPLSRARRGGRLTDRIMPQPTIVQAPSFWERVVWPFLDKLTAPGSAIWKNINEDDLRVRLMRAGFPLGLRAQTFLLVKIASIFIAMLMFALCYPSLGLVTEQWGISLPTVFFIPFLGIGALYGFRLPDIWLGIKIKARQNAIQLQLPDTIDLISISVEAGLGLIAAIQRIAERFPNELSEEFLRTLQEVRLGRPQGEALRDMARRVDVPDLTSLLTAIVQAEQLGLAVSNVLRIQSERLRERRAQKAREAAQKAPIKMTFPLVLFIFPALFIIILGPAMIKIFMTNGF
ncbi:type II secretion system F family protein [bacterium]|nr:MAG: type II secretion system F family protein [bacterium]